ncbi:MAG TPA: carboxypeptidase regulatory-like domain-containing protein [Bryobacteraceae bacterium]|nr:carboxypeptidase regulatory-like domain-containing protein [Bryobacteraceae bacterium]
MSEKSKNPPSKPGISPGGSVEPHTPPHPEPLMADEPAAMQYSSQSSAGQGGTKGYCEPPRCLPAPCEPPEPLNAEDAECAGALSVKVWAYGDCDSEGPYRAEDELLANVEVILYSATGFVDSRRTSSLGVVMWRDIAVGRYWVTAAVKGSYKGPVTFLGKDERPLASREPNEFPIHVIARAEEIVGLGFQPLPATIKGFTYLDANRNGDPAGQRRINNVPVVFTMGDQPLDCVKTNNDGCFEKEITRLGCITISPRSPIRAGNRILVLPDSGPIAVRTDPGQIYEVPIQYVERLGGFQIIARLAQQVHGKTVVTPLPGVTFSLYRGLSASGDVLRSLTTSGAVPGLFSGLPASDYTIVASGPTAFQGQAIDLVNPAGGVHHHILGPGQEDHVVEFLYRPSLGRILGSVINLRGAALVGITVTLTSSATGSLPRTATTDHAGQYQFLDVVPGIYTVSVESEVVRAHDGSDWEVPESAQAGQVVSVSSGAPVAGPTFQLTPEVHKIIGTFTGPDGKPLAFLRVDIQDNAGNVQAKLQTDQTGYYEWIAPVAGVYYVVPHTSGGFPVNRFQASVNSIKEISAQLFTEPPGPDAHPRPSGSGGMGPRDADVRESVSDLQSYPVLTEEVPAGGPASATRPASPGRIGGSSELGVTADRAIREVLSWRTKSDDPKGFVGALNQAFDLKDVEGHTEFTWTPRSYTVQTDMGAVTGAQASIYTRAKVALDQSMPLLDGLYPLIPYVEAEDLATVQAVVRSQFSALVDEFGIVGGPRVSRVDEMFHLLLGPGDPTNPESVPREASLGLVRQRFGLERRFVTTVDDEQNLTNYIILVDYVIGLKQSWNHDKSFFIRNGVKKGFEPFFGTQLVLISRALDVVAQGVQDAYFTMDSVFVTDAERQTAQLNFAGLPVTVPTAERVPETIIFPKETSGLFIAELLDWVNRSASEELPQLLQDAGKDGLESFRASTNRLRRLVHGALELANRRTTIARDLARGLPPGYHTPRVQRAILLLADGLDEAYRLAFQVPEPQFPAEVSQNRLDHIESALRAIEKKLGI